MEVSEIMTKNVISVKPSEKVVEVANLLMRKGFNGIPVVEDGKVLGMITKSDLISKGPISFHIPSLIKFMQELRIDKSIQNNRDEKLISIFKADAKMIMNSNYIFVSPHTKVTELIKIFQEKHVNPIPVIDKEKRLVGIVSLSDIMRIISRFREAEIDFLSKGEE